MSDSSLCVVKLGGSHALRPHLKAWLAALAACAGEVVLVPGGGPFADTVRTAQPVMGFDDRTAHHMALLAMEQFGIAIVGMASAFVTASTLEEIHCAVAADKVPVWLPTCMVLADLHLPQTWDLTSDSLAAWLAGHLRARRIIMVKHVGAHAEADAVDPLFGTYLAASGAECIFLGASDAALLKPAAGAYRRAANREPG